MTVPDVSKKTVQEATNELRKLGLNVGDFPSEKPSKDVDTGKVIGTDPKGGTQVPAGTTVNLTVSTGKDGGGGNNNQQPNPGGGGDNNDG